MKYYIDTCIWIDLYENREDNFRPLGEFALQFLSYLNCEDVIFYSKLTLKELRKKYSDKAIASIFEIVKDNLVFIEFLEEDFVNSKIILSSGLVHYSDAMHIALARRVSAVLVTRDKEILISGLIDSHKPEELI